MRTPGGPDDGPAQDSGAGLELTTDGQGRTVVGHSGAWLGSSSLVVLYPDESVGGAITCNIDDDDTLDARMDELLGIWLD